MNRKGITQRLKGLFLLVTYLVILATGFLHIHGYEQDEVVCQDCKEHVKHNGHIGQGTAMNIDCVLCKVVHSTHITPEVLTLSAVVLLTFTFMMPKVQDVLHRLVRLPSLRAPPVMG